MHLSYKYLSDIMILKCFSVKDEILLIILLTEFGCEQCLTDLLSSHQKITAKSTNKCIYCALPFLFELVDSMQAGNF